MAAQRTTAATGTGTAAWPWKNLAKAALRSIRDGDLDGAIRKLAEAERRGPRLESVRRRLARALSDRALSANGDDPRSRIAAQTDACALTPRDPQVWRNLGKIHYGLGDYSSALEAFQEARGVGDDPDVISRFTTLADLRLGDGGDGGNGPVPLRVLRALRAGKPKVAVKETARSRRPEDRLCRALANLAAGSPRRALKQLESLIRSKPTLLSVSMRNVRHYLGRLLLQEARAREAVAHLRLAAQEEKRDGRLPPRSEPFLFLALLRATTESVQAGNPDAAIHFLGEAESMSADDPARKEQSTTVRRTVIRRLIKGDRFADTLPLLELASKVDPRSALAQKDVALAFERMGATDRAIRRWERAIRNAKQRLHEDPEDPTARPIAVAVLSHAARLDRHAGRMGEAARKLSFSLQLDPSRYRSRCELAEILMALGKYRDALKHLHPIESDPRAGPELWTQMGIACDRLGKAQKAVAYWEKAADRHPLARRLLLGRLHEEFLLRFRGGDLQGARKAVDRAREIDPADRDGILDATCLFLAWEGEEDEDLVALAAADPSHVQPAHGWGGGEFGLHPEVRQGIPQVATRVCCGDGTRCDAVRTLVQRLVAKNGPEQAMEIQKSLLQEGCKVVAESLAAALAEEEDPG